MTATTTRYASPDISPEVAKFIEDLGEWVGYCETHHVIHGGMANYIWWMVLDKLGDIGDEIWFQGWYRAKDDRPLKKPNFEIKKYDNSMHQDMAREAKAFRATIEKGLWWLYKNQPWA